MTSRDQFNLLESFGMRRQHRVLDIGCGALGLGCQLIRHLNPRCYFGVEPRQSLIEDGVSSGLGHDLFDQKQPQFLTVVDFAFHKFAVKFDFMIAHGLFPHIALPMIRRCLHEAAASLQPDGVLLASWMAGPVDHAGEGWNPQVQAEYRVATLESLAQEAGLMMRVLDRWHAGGQFWAAFFLPAYKNIPPEPQAASLPSLSEGNAGYLEQVRDAGGYYMVSGWAIDPETRTPATEVLMADPTGRILASIRTGQPRPDTIATFGDGTLMSGFRALVKDDPSRLSFFAVTATQKVYRITR